MSAPAKKTGLSLYADLLGSDKQRAQGATISGAPVKYDVKKDADDDAQRKKDASLKFQPIKRPQAQQKSAKPKVVPPSSSSSHKFSSSTVTATAGSPEKQLPSSTPQQPPSVQRSNFEDWVGDEDDSYYYQDRQRGPKKKKKKGRGQEVRSWDWDDIYDPTLPNSYADYKGSEEQHKEIRDWKARLYYHQLKEARTGKSGAASSDEGERSRPMNSMFAPPSTLNFAPPSFDDVPRPHSIDEDDDEYYPQQDLGLRDTPPSFAPPSFAPPAATDNSTGEDAYMRRMRMSDVVAEEAIPLPAPPAVAPTVPRIVQKPEVDLDAKRAEAQAKIAAFKAKLQKPPAKVDIVPAVAPIVPKAMDQIPPPPPPPPAKEAENTISRAPVRYELPPSDLPIDYDAAMADGGDGEDVTSEAEQPRSNRPGQKGFAERLLKKYGWEKGKGLGAQGEGITTALIGKADKRKKLSDSQGGGWAQPANMGKIVGGKRRKVEEEGDDARFGNMSEVIKLEDMLNGLDVQREIEDNNLMQQIGDEMGNKYGNIERLFIWSEEMGGKNEVFVKFNSQLSALRAVNATDGMSFAGNSVVARFWDSEMFEKGQYA